MMGIIQVCTVLKYSTAIRFQFDASPMVDETAGEKFRDTGRLRDRRAVKDCIVQIEDRWELRRSSGELIAVVTGGVGAANGEVADAEVAAVECGKGYLFD
ncbi:hypothetical protein WAI453_011452 [Rhynchosporium graminicola]